MRQLNGNLVNKGLIDLDPNLSKLISNGEQKKLLDKSDREPNNVRRPSNQANKPVITNENKMLNDSKLDQLLIKMEKGNENQPAQSMANLASQSQLALSQIQQQLLHQQQFGFQQNLLNQQTGLPPLCANGELSAEQLNQLYYYYYPYYYLYKLNENSGKTTV